MGNGKVILIGGLFLSAAGILYLATKTSGVNPPGKTLTSITITPAILPLNIGDTYQLRVIAHYSDSSTLDVTDLVTWVISAQQVITLSDTGYVIAIAEGVASFVAEYQSKSAPVSVVVSQDGGDGGDTHPKFQIGDIITDIGSSPGNQFYLMRVANYSPDPAEHFGTYTLQYLAGSLNGTFTGYFVDSADNNFEISTNHISATEGDVFSINGGGYITVFGVNVDNIFIADGYYPNYNHSSYRYLTWQEFSALSPTYVDHVNVYEGA